MDWEIIGIIGLCVAFAVLMGIFLWNQIEIDRWFE